MKSQKRKSCKQEIIDALREKRTFDLDHDTMGYPTIHWLIGKWILRNYSPFIQDERLHNGHLKAIRTNLEAAIKDLEENQKTPVYKGPKDSKRIGYITLDAGYRNAKEQDYLRITLRGQKLVEAIKRKIEFKHQDRLPDFFVKTLALPEVKEQTL